MKAPCFLISDVDGSNHRLALHRLVRRVLESVDPPHSLRVSRSQGYGPTVNALDQTLGCADTASISPETLLRLSEGTDEWFYNLDVSLNEGVVRFGLHDSTILFVEAERTMGTSIIDGFEQVVETAQAPLAPDRNRS